MALPTCEYITDLRDISGGASGLLKNEGMSASSKTRNESDLLAVPQQRNGVVDIQPKRDAAFQARTIRGAPSKSETLKDGVGVLRGGAPEGAWDARRCGPAMSYGRASVRSRSRTSTGGDSSGMASTM